MAPEARRKGETRTRSRCIVRPLFLPFYVMAISQERQQPEQRAQYILAFGHPGHRFHMQGMQSKHRGHKKTSPHGSRHSCQNQEDQNRVDRMEQQARKVMSPGVQTEPLTIQHVGQPGQWMPIAANRAAHRPFDVFPCQSRLHMRIPRDITRIIVENKIVVDGRGGM